MSEEEIQRRYDDARQEWEGLRSTIFAGGFMAMFSWMDLLFFGLAVVTAFRIGASGLGASD